MPTSQTPELLAEVLSGETIPIQTQAYFRRRLRLRIYELVTGKFYQLETMSQADLARRIGRRPEVINRLLGAPGNWTIDTISDLLLALSCELEIDIGNLVEKFRSSTPEDVTAAIIRAQRPFAQGQDVDSANALRNVGHMR